MKTEGYGGLVTCGERIYHKDNLDIKDVLKYNFTIDNGEVNYTTEVQEKASRTGNSYNNVYLNSGNKGKRKGCGYTFDFDK
jgi:hypothetical protein